MTHFRRMLSALTIVILAVTVLSGCGDDSDGGTGDETIKVGVLQISEAELIDSIVSGFQDSFRKAVAPQKVEFKLLNAQGDNSLIQSIARQLHEGDSDLFAVAGTPGIVALHSLEKERPIIGLAMTDPVEAKVAKSAKLSGTNVTGSLGYIPPAQVLEKVLAMDPAPRVLGTMYDPSNDASRIWTTAFKKAVASEGIKLRESTITGPGDVASAARSLTGRADTWVIPPDTTVIAGLAGVGAAASSGDAAVFVTAGDPKTPGILASVGPDYAALGKLAGDVAARVIDGAEPGEVPFAEPAGATLVPNDQTVKKLGVTLPSSDG